MTTLQTIALADLTVSPTKSQLERRKHFDTTAIAELSASIKEIGLLNPIVARRVNGHMEIVAGERRYLAAQAAGLEAVPVNVRELTDEQVIEVQLIENLQREGLHELAEAEGYEALMKLHGYTVEQLVAKLARSKAYVYARLKLLALGKEARKAFYAGDLNASTALLLARIPDDGLQRKALNDVTRRDWTGNTMSYRRAAEHVHEHFMLQLKDAPFPPADAELLPKAGACGPCPKRTGNHRELFDDVKSADVCTDPICFAAKRAVHVARQVAAAKANGQTVIVGKEAAKITPPYGDGTPSGYVKLDSRCYDDPKNRTYRQIIGKAVTPVLIESKAGDVIECVPQKEAREALKVAGVKPARESNDGNAIYRKEQAVRDKKAKAERKFRREVLEYVLQKAPAKAGDLDLNETAVEFFRQHQADGQKLLLDVLGIAPPKAKYHDARVAEKAFTDHLAAGKPATLARALLLLTLVSDLQVHSYTNNKPTRLLDEAKRLKVDVEKIRKDLKAAEVKKPAKKMPRKAP